MAINFSWKISSLEVSKINENFEDLVITVHWRLVGTDEETGVLQDIYGALQLSEPESPESFIELASLSKDVVVGWLEEAFSVVEEGESLSNLEKMRQTVANLVAEKIQPKVEQLVPSWE